ncbi:MAG: hypothetical protein MMC33_010135 [Icmadophila ericetorum]|nr:hypothetical protein [Icmadophila ericetorum]
MKLLLTASLIRKKSQAPKEPRVLEGGSDQSELTETHRLIDLIDEIRKSDETKMGGIFPQLIAQKSTLLQDRLQNKSVDTSMFPFMMIWSDHLADARQDA